MLRPERAFDFARSGKVEPAQCGVCERWTSRGDWLPSGSRNPFTKQTPHDNFVCERCMQEARDLQSLSKACERWERRRRGREVLNGDRET